MPILPTPDYQPPFPFHSGHLATLYPPVLRRTPDHGSATRERIETPDGDFLDIDRHPSRIGKTRKLAVVSHGLEGNSKKKYVLGMTRTLTGLGYDVAAWNQRGCSGEPNRLPRSYHSGETNDLHSILTHCLESGPYEEAVLTGFSMGGNQILKYLGENPDRVPAEVNAAATFSVPCDLYGCERRISAPAMRIYLEYFMRGLRQKVREKAAMFPEKIDPTQLDGINSLRRFDDRFTAPSCGFASAEDYYDKCSSGQFLANISVPTLLVQAKDDPFLSQSCYPRIQAGESEYVFLEMPKHGGHVGFVQSTGDNVYWSEQRVASFLSELG